MVGWPTGAALSANETFPYVASTNISHHKQQIENKLHSRELQQADYIR